MTEPATLALADIALRAAAAGMLILLAAAFARGWRADASARLGVLFALGTAVYALVSSPHFGWRPGALSAGLVFVAMLNAVFFWWFATALFDDGFRWRSWRLAPAAALIALYAALRAGGAAGETGWAVALHQALVIAMMGHVLWLALRHRGDDLVEPRRRFRLVFAAVVGVTGLVIAIAEFALAGGPAPDWLIAVHGASLAALALGFSIFVLRPVALFAPVAPAAPEARPVPPQSGDAADARDLARLEAAMAAGAWTREGLTVAGLAAEIGLPEHRLRRLINQQLGFRNFSAFLARRRITAAKALLADPANARRQVLQIALDVGYGSIGPFNRAFKEATGQTPTEYRQAALGGGGPDVS